LGRANDSWLADFHCRVSIAGGKLGMLKLNVPTTWIGPFELKANTAASINVVSANEQSAVLSVRFAKPIDSGKTLDLSIRGPIAVSNLSPVQVPQIEIVDQPQLASFISVPTSLEGQAVAWSQLRVRPADLPPELRRAHSQNYSARTFEVVGRPFRVRFLSQAAELPAPRLRLVDTAIVDGPNGGRLMLTRFTMASQGLKNCSIRLPSGQNLLAVNLDGQPALIHAAGEHSWQLELGSAQVPQVIDVVTSIDPSEAATGSSKRRPSLAVGTAAIPVELSLWSYSGPLSTAVRQGRDAAAVSAAEQAALRFDRSIGIAESATPLATELSLLDNHAWFAFWMDLLTRLRDEARQAARQTSQGHAAQVVPPADDQLNRTVNRLDEWIRQYQQAKGEKDAQRTAAAEFQASAADVTWPVSLTAGMQHAHLVADGGTDRVPVETGFDGAMPWSTRALAMGMIVGAAIAGVVVVRSPKAVDFICRWPHALGVLLGLVYWAWLWPSWLGLVIAALSVVRAVRPNWPGHSARAEGSTVLRARTQASSSADK
jgi:hypothetical protein